MIMDHKAFVFDTNKFHAEIEPVMRQYQEHQGGTPVYMRASR
jgi:hypothetical protein